MERSSGEAPLHSGIGGEDGGSGRIRHIADRMTDFPGGSLEVDRWNGPVMGNRMGFGGDSMKMWAEEAHVIQMLELKLQFLTEMLEIHGTIHDRLKELSGMSEDETGCLPRILDEIEEDMILLEQRRFDCDLVDQCVRALGTKKNPFIDRIADNIHARLTELIDSNELLHRRIQAVMRKALYSHHFRYARIYLAVERFRKRCGYETSGGHSRRNGPIQQGLYTEGFAGP